MSGGTADEARAFITDQAADKRTRLIDRLVADGIPPIVATIPDAVRRYLADVRNAGYVVSDEFHRLIETAQGLDASSGVWPAALYADVRNAVEAPTDDLLIDLERIEIDGRSMDDARFVTRNVQVTLDSNWIDSGVFVRNGQRVQVSATGVITIGRTRITPDGLQRTDPSAPLPNAAASCGVPNVLRSVVTHGSPFASVPSVGASTPPPSWSSRTRSAPLRAATTAYYRAMEAMTTRLVPLFALALDLPADYFAAAFAERA